MSTATASPTTARTTSRQSATRPSGAPGRPRGAWVHSWLLVGALLLQALAAEARPRERWPLVRGIEGQAALQLDLGRSLRGARLAAAHGRDRSAPARLSAIEKARLDARRVAAATRLGPTEKLARLVAIVQHRIPLRGDQEARASVLAEREVRALGFTRLSSHVAGRAGVCRERAFLLATLLAEAGVPARVRYGVLYDGAGAALAGHAWVEVGPARRPQLLDPSIAETMPASSSQQVEEAVRGGVRRVRARVTASHIYVPTDDLKIER